MRGAITRHDAFGVNFMAREDDSLATTFTQGLFQLAINPWAGVDTQCAARPAPYNYSFSMRAMQCAPTISLCFLSSVDYFCNSEYLYSYVRFAFHAPSMKVHAH